MLSKTSRVRVTSEIGRLRRVLVHEPGLEVDRMVPAMMEELLFDDILFGDRAREEHRRFRRVLQMLGVETIEAGGLLAEALAEDAARDWILERLPGLSPMLHEEMRRAPAEQLVSMLVAGVLPAMAHRSEAEDLYEIPPLSNWCFQRDPQVVLGESLLPASMVTPARRREATLARALFRFHPALANVPVLFEPGASLEGGDVLVLSPQVIAVGQSQRTDRAAVAELARVLARRPDGPRWLLAVELPHRRAYMHLDTVLTPSTATPPPGSPPGCGRDRGRPSSRRTCTRRS
jgi:arginine deiminase